MKTAPSMFGVDNEGIQQKKHQNIWMLQHKAQLHDMKPSLCSAHFISCEPHEVFVVSVVTRIWDGQSVVRLLAHPTSYSMGIVGSFPRKRAAWGRSCAGVTNECSYTSHTPTYFQFFLYVTQHYQVVRTNRSTFNMILLCNQLLLTKPTYVTLSNYYEFCKNDMPTREEHHRKSLPVATKHCLAGKNTP